VSAPWRVLDVSGVSIPLAVRKGQLVVGDQEVPLADIACIVMGTNSSWGADVVAKAAHYDIPIITCDWRGVPISCTFPWSHATRVGARHIAQAELSAPKKKNAWMRIIQSKVLGQAENLAEINPKMAAQLRLQAKAIRSGDPDNIEASAARTYWSQIAPGEEFSRNRDGGGRNSLLNYGYAIIRGCVVRSIVISGLTPTLGIWHHNRSNPFALADDLIEPFRPAVDSTVFGFESTATLDDRAVKQALVEVLSIPMGLEGNTVATSILGLAQSFAQYVEGDLSSLPVPKWQLVDG
jgi:CRISPR-associated protein Cas1